MAKIILEEESYKIIGACMEVHSQLGMGFKEEVYKDALELEFKQRGIPYQREKSFKIIYKGTVLRRRYPADFIVYNSIILEIKAKPIIIESFIAQTINYLKISGIRLGIIANLGEKSFRSRRVVF